MGRKRPRCGQNTFLGISPILKPTMKNTEYIESGMYETITVHHFVPACGDLLGGIIWDQDEIRTQMEHS